MKAVYVLAAIWCFVLGMTQSAAEWVIQLTDWAVCGLAIYTAFRVHSIWRWIFALVAVIFNPFAPIHFGSEDWPSVRILCAVFMLVFGLSGGTQKASRVS